MPRLNLLVLRARDADALAAFYSSFGLNFVRHRHGEKAVEHYAFEDNGGTFEIYPATGSGPTQSLRLGFSVDDVFRCVKQALLAGGKLIHGPADSPWGVRAVVSDLEGHRIELSQRERMTDLPTCTSA